MTDADRARHDAAKAKFHILEVIETGQHTKARCGCGEWNWPHLIDRPGPDPRWQEMCESHAEHRQAHQVDLDKLTPEDWTWPQDLRPFK
jgi:hypothetical protein